MLNLAKPLLRSKSLMKPLFYSIRNNWCQIWWFETPLGKAIFNYDNDDDVGLVTPLTEKMKKPSGKRYHLVDSVLLETFSSHTSENRRYFFFCVCFFFSFSCNLVFSLEFPTTTWSVIRNMEWHSLSQNSKFRNKTQQTTTQPHPTSVLLLMSHTHHLFNCFSLF